MTNPLTWAIAGLILIKPIINYLLGTNQTWADIAETGRKALILVGYGISTVLKAVGGWFSNLGSNIYNGFVKLGEWIVNGIKNLLSFIPTKDAGGGIGQGLFRNAGGREFVMSNSTTRAAENVIGGSLTQDRLLNALGAKRISYYDNRRIDSKLSQNDRRIIANDTMSILAGAI
jgi:hypothetical protein